MGWLPVGDDWNGGGVGRREGVLPPEEHPTKGSTHSFLSTKFSEHRSLSTRLSTLRHWTRQGRPEHPRPSQRPPLRKPTPLFLIKNVRVIFKKNPKDGKRNL